MRIVCLVPSATEIICQLGLGESLGRPATHARGAGHRGVNE